MVNGNVHNSHLFDLLPVGTWLCFSLSFLTSVRSSHVAHESRTVAARRHSPAYIILLLATSWDFLAWLSFSSPLNSVKDRFTHSRWCYSSTTIESSLNNTTRVRVRELPVASCIEMSKYEANEAKWNFIFINSRSISQTIMWFWSESWVWGWVCKTKNEMKRETECKWNRKKT